MMLTHLQIYDARERHLVGIADVALAPLRWFQRPRRRPPVRRILLMRLERIGDLLMVIDAIRDARTAWPAAEIDLAVGSWNAPVASLVPGISRVVTADAPWLARDTPGDSWRTLIAKARAWRSQRYDLVVNFEPDIRSNLLAWLSAAPARFGYSSGGGGSLLTDATVYDQRSHVSMNAQRLIARAAQGHDLPGGTSSRLALPREASSRARNMLRALPRPMVGIHASGGRESKQWHLDRFAAAARAIVDARGGTIVLTGSAGDRPLIDRVAADLAGVRVIDAGGTVDLVTLAALLAELDVLVTGDTGPMHLAAAVGTPVVALFGPSNPERYGPIGEAHRVLRVDLPCSPCGQVRLPPERCRGHVPECLDRINVERVVAAALDVIDGPASAARPVRT